MRSDIQPVVCIDTREPADPHPWARWFTCETTRGTLATGDFSLLGCHEMVCIERKTLNDLIGCLTTGRERFTRELQRASRIPDFYCVIESDYSDILKGAYRSKMHPEAAFQSILALQQRYRVPFLFAGDTKTAAKLTESILLRWLTEHLKAVEAASRGAQATG